jgi:hypothetical protein
MGVAIKSEFKVKVNQAVLNKMLSAPGKALVQTAMACETDLLGSNTLPMGDTEMLEQSTHVGAVNESHVFIATDVPYARRLYFHPEFHFRKDKHGSAGGRWFDTYIISPKKKFAENALIKLLRRHSR